VQSISNIRLEADSELTSYSGLVLFEHLFESLGLRERPGRCFGHLVGESIVGFPRVFLLLVVHLLLGFRRLRGLDYYRHDPYVARVVGLTELPDVSTVSRTLSLADEKALERGRALLREGVLHRLEQEDFKRVTLDFDGSVQSTSGRVEGTAVGYNKKKKGARSYYPFFCTVAQTSQFLDFLHRPGNVHDSTDASQFVQECFGHLKRAVPDAIREARFDSAHFEEKRLVALDDDGVEFTCSVPFERFVELKQLIEQQQTWIGLDEKWSYSTVGLAPKSWEAGRRFRYLVYRQRVPKRQKGPLQLDLFEPKDFEYQYKVVVTNKKGSVQSVLSFHNGRGSQEKVFAEGKQFSALDVIATMRLQANRCFTLASMLAHNLGRELQMRVKTREERAGAKRPAMWEFMTLGTLRQRWLHRAGRLVRPQGRLTLVVSGHDGLREEFEALLAGAKQVEGARKAA
jgi:hypothetical protein